ncbi:5-oxoprolinase subunit PxpB [Marinicella meishanensis]|uniref:5-oxoprolinase subunit PxpB n=1 Tax=Marinicella meishanensis TaxID=2873263 RepID=UPI001CC03A02|nr:5-oxoprolinase subunit PxpB [Marinicella sp. NBU2979]
MSQPLVMHSWLPNGDCAVIIGFKPSTDRLRGIHGLCADLLHQPLPGLINVIPAEASLTLVFDLPLADHQDLLPVLTDRCQRLKDWQPETKTHQIPVCYDARVAPDLEFVCDQLGMTHETLVARHSAVEYRVNMLGFLPGFAYLADNHPTIKLPRKATPARSVAAGSVAVAGTQTGLYALSSPGGWQVIGRTPVALIDWANDHQPMRFSPLDRVRFQAIDWATFQSWEPPA